MLSGGRLGLNASSVFDFFCRPTRFGSDSRVHACLQPTTWRGVTAHGLRHGRSVLEQLPPSSSYPRCGCSAAGRRLDQPPQRCRRTSPGSPRRRRWPPLSVPRACALLSACSTRRRWRRCERGLRRSSRGSGRTGGRSGGSTCTRRRRPRSQSLPSTPPSPRRPRRCSAQSTTSRSAGWWCRILAPSCWREMQRDAALPHRPACCRRDGAAAGAWARLACLPGALLRSRWMGPQVAHGHAAPLCVPRAPAAALAVCLCAAVRPPPRQRAHRVPPRVAHQGGGCTRRITTPPRTARQLGTTRAVTRTPLFAHSAPRTNAGLHSHSRTRLHPGLARTGFRAHTLRREAAQPCRLGHHGDASPTRPTLTRP